LLPVTWVMISMVLVASYELYDGKSMLLIG